MCAITKNNLLRLLVQKSIEIRCNIKTCGYSNLKYVVKLKEIKWSFVLAGLGVFQHSFLLLSL
jgi:hypothetical protein